MSQSDRRQLNIEECAADFDWVGIILVILYQHDEANNVDVLGFIYERVDLWYISSIQEVVLQVVISGDNNIMINVLKILIICMIYLTIING